MLDVLKNRWELVLSAQSFCWVRRPVWGAGVSQCVARQVFDKPLLESERLPALATFLEASPVRYQAVRVSVDDSWLYSSQVTPLNNAERWADVEAYTAVRLQEVFELSVPLRVVCEPGLQGPYWACALRQSDLDAVERLLRVHRLKVGACVPQWMLVMNPVAHLVRSDDAVLLLNDLYTHLLLISQGRMLAVKHWPFALHRLLAKDVQGLLHQEIRRHGCPDPQRWAVVGQPQLPQGDGTKWDTLGQAGDVLSVWGVQP